MLIKLYENNPNPKEIAKIVDILRDGGIIIYPTDTLYAFGCDIHNSKSVEKICRLKNIDPEKMPLSFVCSDISHISQYSNLNNATFKLLKTCLPGPFTFLLKGNSSLPKMFKKKKEVGVRIPDNKISLAIVEALGNPLLSSSVFINEEELSFTTNPELLEETYRYIVDCVVDGGEGGIEGSTIIDCTGDEPEVKRKGKGIVIGY